MNSENSRRVVTSMQVVERKVSSASHQKKNKTKRLLRNTVISAAVSVCLGGTAITAALYPKRTKDVMSHLTAGFEYDETLGRLQFVSNILPESAMVFLSEENTNAVSMNSPVTAQIIHTWNPSEPWVEYANNGEVVTCSDGEIVTIVQNHQGEYTVRIMHDNGLESVYSGLKQVYMKEYDTVQMGQAIGNSDGFTAFELRKDGLSILPDFATDSCV